MGWDALLHDAPFTRCTLIVIDFETLTPAGRPPEPIEVAAVMLHPRDAGLVETDRFQSLMRPPADVTMTWRDRLTGITESHLAAAPTAAEVMDRLDARLTHPTAAAASTVSYRVIAHSAGTENTVITGQRSHCPILATTPMLDTVKLARVVYRDLTRHGLTDLAQHLDLPIPVDRHRAMADVDLTVAVLRQLLTAGPWASLLEIERDGRFTPRPVKEPDHQDALF